MYRLEQLKVIFMCESSGGGGEGPDPHPLENSFFLIKRVKEPDHTPSPLGKHLNKPRTPPPPKKNLDPHDLISKWCQTIIDIYVKSK